MARTARRQRESSKETKAAGTEEKTTGANGTEEDASEADVDVRMRGPAGAVREAAGRLASEPEAKDPKTEEDDGQEIDDPIAALLADPRNLVVVKRLKPRDWNGQRATGTVDTYECPIDRDEIESDTFDRHGGKRYKATVHPNTAGGQAKILSAWTFSDDRLPPVLEGAGEHVVDNAEDSEVETDDPLEVARNAIKRKMVFLNDRAQLKQAEQALAELEAADPKDKKEGNRGPDERDAQIRDLQEQLKSKNLEDRMNARFGMLEKSIGDLSGAMTRFLDNQANKPSQDDGTKALLLQMLQSGDARFNALMSNFTNAITKRDAPQQQQTVMTMLGEIAKMKEVFGSDNSRIKDLETRLLDLALDRLEGGGGNGGDSEDDPIKLAIKELSPTFRTYVEKKLENEGKEKVRDMSQEEKRAYFKKAAQEEGKKLEDKWRKEGYLVRVPPTPKKKLPPPGQKPDDQKRKESEAAAQLGTSKTVEVKMVDTTSPPTPPGSEPGSESEAEEGAEMGRYAQMAHIGKVEIPPSPHEDGYSRQRAVDFVLDAIRSEIKDRIPQDNPDETFVVGDALDRFDDELLFSIGQAESGKQLEDVLSPWADEAKFSDVKRAGDADPKVKSYLERLIITLKDKWREKASKPPEK